MSQRSSSKRAGYGFINGLTSVLFIVLIGTPYAQAAPIESVASESVTPTNEKAPSDETAQTVTPDADTGTTLAAQIQPTSKALSAANQELLSRNAQLQRQVNDLQTQVNVLIYESKGQLFLYGAFTVLISLLVGVFISWLVFARRARW